MSLGPIPSQPLPAAPISHSKKKQAPLTTAPATTSQLAISLAQKTPTPPSTRPTIQNIAVQKTTDTHDGMTKWMSKVTALAMESVPAIALVNCNYLPPHLIYKSPAQKRLIETPCQEAISGRRFSVRNVGDGRPVFAYKKVFLK